MEYNFLIESFEFMNERELNTLLILLQSLIKTLTQLIQTNKSVKFKIIRIFEISKSQQKKVLNKSQLADLWHLKCM